jgi:hypothetical protein
LNEVVIAFEREGLVPRSLLDETHRAAAAAGCIGKSDTVAEELLEAEAPAGVVGDGGVADKHDVERRGCGGRGGTGRSGIGAFREQGATREEGYAEERDEPCKETWGER